MLLYGMFSAKFNLFPYPAINEVLQEAGKIFRSAENNEWYYRDTSFTRHIPTHHPERMQPGPTLITSMAANHELSVRVFTPSGNVIHEWNPDWFELWPDCSHLPEERVPKSKPGTHIHGCLLMDNGDLVFNFEQLGLVRVDVCGEVRWRLPCLTHHSVTTDASGNMWICGELVHQHDLPQFKSLIPPVYEPTLLNVSPDGKVLREIRLFDILKKNHLNGLLILSTLLNENTRVTGDLLHLNDVESFPATLPEGSFKTGDLLVSLRNINTVLVLDAENLTVKYKTTGDVARQHDPDFIDGYTLSVFDNNNIRLGPEPPQSRIVIKGVNGRVDSTYYSGTAEEPFFTEIMGKHQWLENGNLLITESMRGRVFEIDRSGRIVWEFVNIIKPGVAGIVEQATRLSPRFDHTFFQTQINRNK